MTVMVTHRVTKHSGSMEVKKQQGLSATQEWFPRSRITPGVVPTASILFLGPSHCPTCCWELQTHPPHPVGSFSKTEPHVQSD